MFRGRFFGTLLALLLIVGLLGLAGSSIYRAGWTQGYFTGKITDASEGGVEIISPDPDPGRALHRGYSPFDSIIRGIIKFFLLFMVIGLIFKLFFGLIFWRRRGRWGKHWKRGDGWDDNHGWGHGPKPPWYDETSDEPVMKA